MAFSYYNITFGLNKIINSKKNTINGGGNSRVFFKNVIKLQMNQENSEKIKIKLEPENVIFQGPPSLSELIIPALSIFTVIGIIPFIATLTRQFWVRYTITNRRISVDSGFQGKERVEIVYRDIKKISKITRFGGLTADVVIVLKDNARLELRSLPDWEENMKFIEKNITDN